MTLIELMVAVALTAILGMIAMFSMRSNIERNRIESELYGLVGDLQFARSEAIRRGQPVAVCASSNGFACLDDGRWHEGWIVFADPDASGSVASDAAVLRRHKAWSGGDLIAAPGVGALVYGRDGFLLQLDASSAVLRAEASIGRETLVRCLRINRAGRQAVHPWGEEGCT